MGTPHLSLGLQSYEDEYRLVDGGFKTDSEREDELSVVSPEFSPEFPKLVCCPRNSRNLLECWAFRSPCCEFQWRFNCHSDMCLHIPMHVEWHL